MHNLTEILKKKRSGTFFSLITTLLCLFGFINYMTAANDDYGYDMIVIVVYLLALAVSVVFMVKDFGDCGAILQGILYSAVFGMIIKERIVYFLTGLLGIRRNGIAPGIIMALATSLLMILINIIGANFRREKDEA